MPRCVLIARDCADMIVWLADRRTLAWGFHILHVAAPCQSLGFKLICDRDDGRWIGASAALNLPFAIERGAGWSKIEIGKAVGLRIRVRSDPTDHRDIVIEAEVTNPIVLAQQLAF